MPTYRIPLTFTWPSGERSSDVVITVASDDGAAKRIAQLTGEERVQQSAGKYAQGTVTTGTPEQIGA